MATDLIHDRGRGPEIVGTRITVYNLLPYFLDASVSEAELANLYELTDKQVAAARAYVLNHAETVLARHGEIERRLAAGNPPEVIEQVQRTHARFVQFKEWLASREKAEAMSRPVAGEQRASPFPAFHEWVAQQQQLAERP